LFWRIVPALLAGRIRVEQIAKAFARLAIRFSAAPEKNSPHQAKFMSSGMPGCLFLPHSASFWGKLLPALTPGRNVP